MEFKTEKDNLLFALTTAARALSSKGFGANALDLTLKGNALTVIGSDPDLVISVAAKVAGKKNGTVRLSARLAADVVKSFESGTVELTVGDEEVVISSAGDSFNLRALAMAELPRIDVTGDPIEVPAAAFAEGLRQVGRAALTDDTRAPVLTGVLMQEREGGLRMVATDSYRLAMRDIEAISSLGFKEDVLIPARALA